MAAASAFQRRTAALRKVRSLKLTLVALVVVVCVAYNRVQRDEWFDDGRAIALRGSPSGAAAGSVAPITPAAAAYPWPDGSSRQLLSNCQESEQSCRDIKDRGEHTLAWNLLYWPVMLYSFYGLAVVCDDHFVASLERISGALKLSEDVAGATFMAAGSSAPELFTSTVDVFWFENNVGVGTIVGSAVFNILVIIALSASCSEQALLIDWKPLTRDCVFYGISIALLVWFTQTDDAIAAWESAVLVGWYACYIVFMTRNKEIFDSVDRGLYALHMWRVERAARKAAEEEERARQEGDVEALAAAAAAILAVNEEGQLALDELSLDLDGSQSEEEESEYQIMERRALLRSKFRSAVYAVMAARFLRLMEADLNHRRALWQQRCAVLPRPTRTPAVMKFRAVLLAVRLCSSYLPRLACQHREMMDKQTRGAELEAGRIYVLRAMAEMEEETAARLAPRADLEEEEPPRTRAQKVLARITGWLSLPWNLMLGYTIPNCEEDRWRRWYMLTFFMSILWIGLLSAVLVETASRIGCSLGISTVVMGLTVLAVGTSVPDAMTSVVVARDGMGNMAVSNAIGSNVFDICLGIGLPYFIKTVFVSPGESIAILHTGDIEVSIAILAGTVAIVWIALVASRWRLTKLLGYVLLVFYAAFVAYTLLKPSSC